MRSSCWKYPVLLTRALNCLKLWLLDESLRTVGDNGKHFSFCILRHSAKKIKKKKKDLRITKHLLEFLHFLTGWFCRAVMNNSHTV